jgi:hypothetical protein
MMHLSFLASVGFAALLYGASPSLAQISLGTAGNFGVLGGSAVTNTGSSVITGNLGVSPGTAVTGFPPGTVTLPGTIHSADAVAAQAQIDLTTAYNALAGMPVPIANDLTGLILGNGVGGCSTHARSWRLFFSFDVGSAERDTPARRRGPQWCVLGFPDRVHAHDRLGLGCAVDQCRFK